jgi:hypothetical protein
LGIKKSANLLCAVVYFATFATRTKRDVLLLFVFRVVLGG